MTRDELIFADIEEIVRVNIKAEGARAKASEHYLTKAIHQYTKDTLEILLADIQKIERKYQ